MNYCESFCRTIQRLCNTGGVGGLLPAEYQQVEYLQSTGNNWIDTGINTTNSLQTTAEFALASDYPYGNVKPLFGTALANQYGNVGNIYSISFPSHTQIRVQDSIGSSTNVTIPKIETDSKHTIEYLFGNTRLDGNTITTLSGNITYTNLPMRLFGRYSNSSESNWTMAIQGIRLYHVQLGIYSDASQYRDYYPCYRKADNVTGMYDLVNSEFIPYSGTENFLIGADVN